MIAFKPMDTAKNYESRLMVDKGIAVIKMETFLSHSVRYNKPTYVNTK